MLDENGRLKIKASTRKRGLKSIKERIAVSPILEHVSVRSKDGDETPNLQK